MCVVGWLNRSGAAPTRSAWQLLVSTTNRDEPDVTNDVRGPLFAATCARSRRLDTAHRGGKRPDLRMLFSESVLADYHPPPGGCPRSCLCATSRYGECDER